MMDIDHFKRVNDTHGHHVGDTVLQAMAGILRERTRDADALARLGGEEFVIVCRHAPLDGAVDTAERIRQAIAAYDFPGVGTVTASFGVAACCEGDTAETLLERADAALYRAKGAGRNRVEADK
jgi:diguanylate cyclase (GGDEF)-like protein